MEDGKGEQSLHARCRLSRRWQQCCAARQETEKGGPGDVGGLSGPQQMPALKNGLRDYLA